MSKKNKDRKRYHKGTRHDYTKGGRVGYGEGDEIIVDPRTGKPIVRNQQVGTPSRVPTPAPTPSPQPFTSTNRYNEETASVAAREAAKQAMAFSGEGTTAPQPERIAEDIVIPDRDTIKNIGRQAAQTAFRGDLDRGGYGPPGGGPGNTPTPTPAPTPSPAQEKFEEERGERIVRTGEQAEAIARGEIPEGAIPSAEVAKVQTQGYDLETINLAQQKGVTPEYVKQVGTEQVQQMENVSTVAEPTPLQASTMEAAQVDGAATVDTATGQVSEESIAQAAGVENVPTIDSAEIDIPEGALTERVIGTLSEGAKSNAAINAGSSLSRITRAKKQLSNAGLSDADITELGNDPESLEARLADFSETERGIIEGLPQEALVSNQLDSLLSGIEEGEVPTWARPAVASVEAMLAQRGMEASTVGRDALLNAIIQSAMPMAQANAQAIQASVGQQKAIEAQESEANAARLQQTALTNASNIFQMDMAQFSSDQQIALSNSKFLQTVGITDASMEQQGIIQDALLLSQANLAEADFNQRTQIQNAQAFLSMDMANLNNEQQSNLLRAQQQQQTLLSNQSAQNAARQFNATSENQTQQFMASLSSQVQQYNASQLNASKQFNVQQANAAEARRVQNELEVNKANAAILNQVNQFNADVDFRRDQWNAQNAQAVLQSNAQWRRQANLADTAAQNAINQQNAQNAFNLSSQAQAFLWQELRDQADYDFKWADSEASRKTQLLYAAIGNESESAKNWSTNLTSITAIIDDIFGDNG